RPRCATAHVEQSHDLLSNDDGKGEGTADAFRVDRLRVLRRHQRPRDTFGGTPGPAANHGVTTDAQTRPDAKAPIGGAACPDDVPGRERAVGVAYRQARHVAAAESVGAPRDLCEDRVEVVAVGEVAGDGSECLRLAATAL